LLTIWQRLLKDRKTNYRLIVYSHSSTNTANLAKIDAVDGEIIGLTEILERETEVEHKPAFVCELIK